MSSAAASPTTPVKYTPGNWPFLTERDQGIIRELTWIGIPRHAAAVLLAFQNYGEGQTITSYWLEHITDARQPEISMALTWLRNEGQVREEKELSRSRKGRPMKVFALTRPVDEYVRTKIAVYLQESGKTVERLVKIFGPVN